MVVFNVIAPYSKRDLKVIKIILDAQILSSCFLRLLTSPRGLSTTPQGDEGLNFSDEPITNCDWSLAQLWSDVIIYVAQCRKITLV